MLSYVDCSLYDNDRVQTVSHVLQTGGPEFNCTHQQLKFTNHSSIQAYYQESMHRQKQVILQKTLIS